MATNMLTCMCKTKEGKTCGNIAKWIDLTWETPLCDNCRKDRIDYYGDVYSECSFSKIEGIDK